MEILIGTFIFCFYISISFSFSFVFLFLHELYLYQCFQHKVMMELVVRCRFFILATFFSIVCIQDLTQFIISFHLYLSQIVILQFIICIFFTEWSVFLVIVPAVGVGPGGSWSLGTFYLFHLRPFLYCSSFIWRALQFNPVFKIDLLWSCEKIDRSSFRNIFFLNTNTTNSSTYISIYWEGPFGTEGV